MYINEFTSLTGRSLDFFFFCNFVVPLWNCDASTTCLFGCVRMYFVLFLVIFFNVVLNVVPSRHSNSKFAVFPMLNVLLDWCSPFELRQNEITKWQKSATQTVCFSSEDHFDTLYSFSSTYVPSNLEFKCLLVWSVETVCFCSENLLIQYNDWWHWIVI